MLAVVATSWRISPGCKLFAKKDLRELRNSCRKREPVPFGFLHGVLKANHNTRMQDEVMPTAPAKRKAAKKPLNPNKLRQRDSGSIEEMLKEASKCVDWFNKRIALFGADTGGKVYKHGASMKQDKHSASLKPSARAYQKAQEKGDYRYIKDMIRATVSYPDCASVAAAIDRLYKDCSKTLKNCKYFKIVEVKSSVDVPKAANYADINMIFVCPVNHHLCELQIHFDKMLAAKDGSGTHNKALKNIGKHSAARKSGARSLQRPASGQQWSAHQQSSSSTGPLPTRNQLRGWLGSEQAVRPDVPSPEEWSGDILAGPRTDSSGSGQEGDASQTAVAEGSREEECRWLHGVARQRRREVTTVLQIGQPCCTGFARHSCFRPGAVFCCAPDGARRSCHCRNSRVCETLQPSQVQWSESCRSEMC